MIPLDFSNALIFIAGLANLLVSALVFSVHARAETRPQRIIGASFLALHVVSGVMLLAMVRVSQ